jgi:hypothetical protein
MHKLTDLRISIISGDDKHVAVHVSDAQAVKNSLGAGLFSKLVEFAESILSEHNDADKVEVGFDETTQKVTVFAKDERRVIADLQGQIAKLNDSDSEAA